MSYRLMSWAVGSALLVIAAPTGARAQPPQATGACLAVPMPTVEGIPGNADEVAGGVRDVFLKYLAGPSAQPVALESRLPSQINGEARQKNCGAILMATVVRKTGGSRLKRAFGDAAGAAAWTLPGGSTVASAAGRTAAASGLRVVSSVASSTKANDEMRLEYRLVAPDGTVQLSQTEHQTARADGEDLLTPIVIRAAETIVTRSAGK